MAIDSLRPWVLPPQIEPTEILVPGFSATRIAAAWQNWFELPTTKSEKV